jgi:hypothetical protein
MIGHNPPPRLVAHESASAREERMIETYRMLGAEHEADLAREAEKWQRASLVQAKVKRRRSSSIARWDSLRRLMYVTLSASPVGASSQTTEGEKR